METDINPVVKRFKEVHGIDLSGFDFSFLMKSIHRRMDETNCTSTDAYFEFLEHHRIEQDLFLDFLQISYSEFFRNPLTFAVLERIILPTLALKKLQSKRNEIRIWSVACAAGQEPYSLAILLKELEIVHRYKFNFRIFATDQSQSQIAEAVQGKYAATAMANMNLKRANQWFNKNGDVYTVKQELAENIDFSVFNLLDEQFSCPQTSIFGDFDLVICANILFYYTPVFRKKIVDKVGKCVANEGFLITGETERDILLMNNYAEVFPYSAIFRKLNKK